MRRTLLGMTALVLAVAALNADDKKPADDKDKAPLMGNYVVVSGEKDGKKEPEERIKGTKVKFTKDSIIVTDVKDKQTYAATYKLDTSAKPWKITMTSVAPEKGTVAKGLVVKADDTVRLIYALKGEAPTDFKTKSNQLMFTLKAEKKEK